MRARTRNILFGSVLLIFAIVAPLAILYARGFVVDADGGRVVRTGMILIDTNVPRVRVTVDNAPTQTEADPVIIRTLQPGTHHIKLERDGYKTWEADIPVTAENVSRVDGLVMVYEEPKEQQPITGDLGPFAVSENSRFIAFSILSGKDIGLWLHTSGEEKNRRLLDDENLDPKNIQEMRWSGNSKILFIKSEDKYFRISPHVSEPSLTELTHLARLSFDQIHWDENEPTLLIYRDAENKLLTWDSAKKDTSPEVMAKNVADFAVASPKIFFLQSPDVTDSSIQRPRLASFDLRVDTLEPTAIADLDIAGTMLLVASDKQIAAIDSAGNLLLLSKVDGTITFEPLDENVSNARWSPDSSLLAYQKSGELWAYDADAYDDQPETFLITRVSTPPDDFIWHKGNHHLWYVSGDQLTLQHVSRIAPQSLVVLTLPRINDKPVDWQTARRGVDVIYPADGALVISTITLAPGD